MNVDPFLRKEYDRAAYNCLHFTRDVWLALTGVDIGQRLDGLFDSYARKVRRSHFKAFERLPERQDPCLVLMTQHGKDPHIGVYLRGKLLHIKEAGANFVPFELGTVGFTHIRFYR